MWRTRRRSVEFDAAPWVGWPKLLQYCERSPRQEHEDLFVTLFETGCRVSEAIELRADQFKYNDEAIIVRNAKVLKQKEKRRAMRNILIKLEDNPLAYKLIEIVENCEHGYLLPKRLRFSGTIDRFRHTARSTVYVKIKEISPEIWPHWLRSQRASHLVFERNLDAYALADWFKWTSMDMPLHYINQTMEKMADNMGIKNVPR